MIQQNHQHDYGETTYSTSFGLGYDNNGLGLDVNVSSSREHLELTYEPSYNPIVGTYTNVSKYTKEKDSTLTLVDSVVLKKITSTDKIKFSSNTTGRIGYVTDTHVAYSEVEDHVVIRVNKYLNFSNFNNYEIEHEPIGLYNDYGGDWTTYEHNVGFSDAVQVYSEDGDNSAVFGVDKSIYRYDYKGEQYFLFKFDIKNLGSSSAKTSVENMDVDISFSGNVDLVSWSPRSDIGSSTQGVSLSLSTWSIKASAEQVTQLADLDITDHSDTVSDMFQLEFEYSNDAGYDDNVQTVFVVAKDLDADYNITMSYNITTMFRDKYGWLNILSRKAFMTEENTITVNAKNSSLDYSIGDDLAELRIDDNMEIHESVFIQTNEKRRLIFRSIDSGTVEVETYRWNSYSNTYLIIYDEYGNIIATDDDSGSYLFSKVQFEAVANTAYFVEVKRDGSTYELDCNICIRYLDILSPDSWDSNYFYEQSYIHNSTTDKPIIVETYSANTYTIETMNHSNFSGYYDTYLTVYDQYGNHIDHNDDGGTSYYSKISGLHIDANSRFFVLIRGYGNDRPLGYKIRINK